MVMAITFGIAILVVVFNVVADILYAVLDPRIATPSGPLRREALSMAQRAEINVAPAPRQVTAPDQCRRAAAADLAKERARRRRDCQVRSSARSGAMPGSSSAGTGWRWPGWSSSSC